MRDGSQSAPLDRYAEAGGRPARPRAQALRRLSAAGPRPPRLDPRLPSPTTRHPPPESARSAIARYPSRATPCRAVSGFQSGTQPRCDGGRAETL
jgi:hypothetical protein